MKNTIIIIIISAIAGLTGCSGLLTKTVTQPMPIITADGVTNIPPPVVTYSVPAKINEVSNAVVQYIPIAQAVLSATPAAPIAGALPSTVNIIFGGLAGLLGLIATYYNRQNNTNHAAAASLAATITQIPNAIPMAMTNAASNGSSGAVAQHIANAQSPT
jgi:hypothetical protein